MTLSENASSYSPVALALVRLLAELTKRGGQDSRVHVFTPLDDIEWITTTESVSLQSEEGNQSEALTQDRVQFQS